MLGKLVHRTAFIASSSKISLSLSTWCQGYRFLVVISPLILPPHTLDMEHISETVLNLLIISSPQDTFPFVIRLMYSEGPKIIWPRPRMGSAFGLNNYRLIITVLTLHSPPPPRYCSKAPTKKSVESGNEEQKRALLWGSFHSLNINECLLSSSSSSSPPSPSSSCSPPRPSFS